MSRPLVNTIRERIAKDLADNALIYKRKLLREVDALWRATDYVGAADKEERLQYLAESVANEFRITGASKDLFLREVKSGQQQIAEVWKDYFSGVIGEEIRLKAGDYEKMRALYTVDFKSLQGDVKDVIVEETRKAIGQGNGISVLRENLKKRGMGAATAQTLANTSLGAFDTSVMISYAQQANITRFKYDGVLDASTRDFCRKHVGKIYTIAELDKLDNGTDLKPVSVYLGAWNCRHYLTAIIEGLND